MTWFAVPVAAILGAVLGFLLCAWLTAGKQRDECEGCALAAMKRVVDERLRDGGE